MPLVSLVAVAVTVALVPALPGGTTEKQFEGYESAHWAGDPQCKADQLARIKPARLQQARTEECTRDAERYREERQERWQAVRTADATQSAAWFAWRQAAIGAVDTGVLILALGASVWAAVAADSAAKTAEDALKRADATLEHARESTETELRAYIHMVNIIPTFPPEGVPGSLVYIQVGWENLGSTPATHCVSEVNAQYFPGELPENFDFPDPPGTHYENQFSMGKGQKMFSDQFPLLITELAKTHVGGPRLYVWGWMDYDDMFVGSRGRRRTEFCAEGYGGYNKDGTRSIVFKAHPRHSGMDSGCMRQPRPWPPEQQRA